jgi:hypothetical protein
VLDVLTRGDLDRVGLALGDTLAASVFVGVETPLVGSAELDTEVDGVVDVVCAAVRETEDETDVETLTGTVFDGVDTPLVGRAVRENEENTETDEDIDTEPDEDEEEVLEALFSDENVAVVDGTNVFDGVSDRVVVGEGDGVIVALSENVADFEPELERVAVADPVPVAVGVGEPVLVTEAVGEVDIDSVLVIVGVVERVPKSVRVFDDDGVADSDDPADGVRVPDGVPDNDGVFEGVPDVDGDCDRVPETDEVSEPFVVAVPVPDTDDPADGV